MQVCFCRLFATQKWPNVYKRFLAIGEAAAVAAESRCCHLNLRSIAAYRESGRQVRMQHTVRVERSFAFEPKPLPSGFKDMFTRLSKARHVCLALPPLDLMTESHEPEQSTLPCLVSLYVCLCVRVCLSTGYLCCLVCLSVGLIPLPHTYTRILSADHDRLLLSDLLAHITHSADPSQCLASSYSSGSFTHALKRKDKLDLPAHPSSGTSL